MTKVGYARVSTHDQRLDLQLAALRTVCDRVVEDQGVSGSTNKRPGLISVLRSLRPGDTLVVWRLDRLGRSIQDLIGIIEKLGKRQVDFQSLTENIDTTSAGGRLVFHLLASMAEFERCLIRERTCAGLEAARARGKRLGRRPSLSDAERQSAFNAVVIDGEQVLEVARRYGIHPRTLARYIERLNSR
ncbi:recombinase family protein [Rhizobium ruizarguesonis]|uniref:recombinase family protein n=1 Tax=Rhizobium ruizarguesonis TaxID=2081791 RepID=UPI00102F5B84|nr:recombinase family protein [Rhizobium ruizarguesonis]TAW77465.1 recombinase family protein [Rhizobium ruizarguesonis]TAX14431.1 recombinase family protein [Rhizobium ruizarguesonis]TAX19262.1 recombinase family protein [Rhizobium ruizarguesonis]